PCHGLRQHGHESLGRCLGDASHPAEEGPYEGGELALVGRAACANEEGRVDRLRAEPARGILALAEVHENRARLILDHAGDQGIAHHSRRHLAPAHRALERAIAEAPEWYLVDLDSRVDKNGI